MQNPFVENQILEQSKFRNIQFWSIRSWKNPILGKPILAQSDSWKIRFWKISLWVLRVYAGPKLAMTIVSNCYLLSFVTPITKTI